MPPAQATRRIRPLLIALALAGALEGCSAARQAVSGPAEPICPQVRFVAQLRSLEIPISQSTDGPAGSVRVILRDAAGDCTLSDGQVTITVEANLTATTSTPAVGGRGLLLPVFAALTEPGSADRIALRQQETAEVIFQTPGRLGELPTGAGQAILILTVPQSGSAQRALLVGLADPTAQALRPR